MKFVLWVSLTFALLPWSVSAVGQNPPESSTAGDQGKIIFVSRCGTCHDADAGKKLPDGSTLLSRLAKNKDPETRLGTRLKKEEERHQVFLYLQPIIEWERLALEKHGNLPR